MDYIDIVVAGPFVQELADPTLEWRGSRNQAIIDVKLMRENIKGVLNG